MFALSACDTGGDGTLASCATPGLVGTFESDAGDREGPIVANLTAEGRLTAIFVMGEDDMGEPDEREATADVDETGALTSTSLALAIENADGADTAFDFDTCEASGKWTFFGEETGTWSIGLREPGVF